MRTQWDCLLQNLGEWHGSFTQCSAQGEEFANTPTVVALEGLDNNATVRQVIRYLTPQPTETVLEYSSLGRGVLFLEPGAFSQGSMQFAPFSEFGAELGLMESSGDRPGNRRLRIVQRFNRDSQFDHLTLIREQRAGTSAPERPPLQLEDLVGTWQGEATTAYPDWRTPTTVPTQLTVYRQGNAEVGQELIIGTGSSAQTLTSCGILRDRTIQFTTGNLPVQVLLLPDGASCTCPLQIQNRCAFFLEMGWLLQPDLRQRLIRRYSDQGEWTSLTLLTERKQTTSAERMKYKG